MTENPILKVLFTLKKHKVKSLLIGGQACIIYGAAEFSRDSDFAILSTPQNLEYLELAMKKLKAELIYVPPLKVEYLNRGHACHFRCMAEGVRDLRVDLISKLRGCESFDKLWERRNTIMVGENGKIDIINLRDLVQSKKTQRDKDWLMLKRLVENDINLHREKPTEFQIKWWLEECRDANMLIELAKQYPEAAKRCSSKRPLLLSAIAMDAQKTESQLREEELKERQKDVEYWKPLRAELEKLRHSQV